MNCPRPAQAHRISRGLRGLVKPSRRSGGLKTRNSLKKPTKALEVPEARIKPPESLVGLVRLQMSLSEPLRASEGLIKASKPSRALAGLERDLSTLTKPSRASERPKAFIGLECAPSCVSCLGK